MTSHQRALATLRHQPTDRVAIAGGWEVDAGFLIEAAGATRAEYEADRRATSIRAFRSLGYDVLFEMALPGLADDRSGRGGTSEEVACAYRQSHEEQTEKYPTPESVIEALSISIDENDSEEDTVGYEALLAGAREWKQISSDLPSVLRWGPTPGFQGYMVFGYVPWLSALVMFPEEIDKYFGRNAAAGRNRAQAMVRVITEEHLLPAVYLGEDICMNSGPLSRPHCCATYTSRT